MSGYPLKISIFFHVKSISMSPKRQKYFRFAIAKKKTKSLPAQLLLPYSII